MKSSALLSWATATTLRAISSPSRPRPACRCTWGRCRRLRRGAHGGGEAAGEIADVCRRPPKQLAPRKRPKREAALGGKGIPQNGRPLANATGEHKDKSCEDNRKAKRADRHERTKTGFWAR